MGRLYDARQAIEQAIKDKHLDPFKMKGQIGLKAGTIISSIEESTPDNDDTLQKLRAAAKDVLNIDL